MLQGRYRWEFWEPFRSRTWWPLCVSSLLASTHDVCIHAMTKDACMHHLCQDFGSGPCTGGLVSGCIIKLAAIRQVANPVMCPTHDRM